jgi:hypothetical protein
MTNAPAGLPTGIAQSMATALTSIWVHLAAVFPSGREPAIGNQDVDRVAVNGQELATVANANLANAGAAADITLRGLPGVPWPGEARVMRGVRRETAGFPGPGQLPAR